MRISLNVLHLSIERKRNNTMKRQSMMDTYKEIKAAYATEYVSTRQDKPYWVGLDSTGVMVATMDLREMRPLTGVETVVAVDSNQAKVRYASIMEEQRIAILRTQPISKYL